MTPGIDLARFEGLPIMVVGDVMLDRYLWCDVNRISPEAPVPVARVRERSESLGGAGNVAANLAGLGCAPLLIGAAGGDSAGVRLNAILEEKGIGGSLVVEPDRPTITKTRIMGGGQQLLRIDEETMGPLSSERARPILNAVGEALAVCKAVILSDYGKGVLWTPGVCREIIGMCRRKDIPVLVDPKGKAWDRYSGATCITPNGMELAQVADMPEDASVQVLEKSASEIRERFELEWLLTTLGAKGMLLVNHKASPMWLSARTREVFDVSGAGDTVIAAVAAGVARGLTVPESAAMANVAAGLVVGKVGTQPVTAEELTSALTHGGTGNDGLKRQ